MLFVMNLVTSINNINKPVKLNQSLQLKFYYLNTTKVFKNKTHFIMKNTKNIYVIEDLINKDRN